MNFINLANIDFEAFRALNTPLCPDCHAVPIQCKRS
jgi:hypothetical protein